MKPKMFILRALTSAGLAIQAAPPSALTTAVYDFKGDGDTANLGSKVTMLVTAELTTETNLVMLERADLSKVLNEQAFGFSGMVSSDAAAKIGQVTGVKVLVAGQIIKTGGERLVIVANIIGTETGRLFAVKTEGVAENLVALCDNLSSNVARTITMQATNLVAPPMESHEQFMERVVKSVTGTNRPSVSISIIANNGFGQNWPNETVQAELGAVLMRAGFIIVDANSDKKPDVEITGSSATEAGLPRGGLFTGRTSLTLKIQERRTGAILGTEHQDATATDVGGNTAGNASGVRAVDELVARIAPLLAK